MKVVIRYILTLSLSAIVFGMSSCSKEWPLYPEPPLPTIDRHDPWEDREAEELSVWISGELVAPLSVYERVRDELATIRLNWGDSVPSVRYVKFYSGYSPGGLDLIVQSGAYERMKNGLHREFDSLNSLLGTSSIGWSSDGASRNRIALRFQYLYNACHLFNMYAVLEGVLSVHGTGVWDIYRRALYATTRADTIRYLFQDGWGDCPAGCIVYRYCYFESTPEVIRFMGEWNTGQESPLPTWHDLIERSKLEHYECKDHSYRFVDATPPARVRDLNIAGDQEGEFVELTFTLPGDDGNEGVPHEFIVQSAPVPISDDNWGSAGFSSMKYPAGGFEGTASVVFRTNALRTNYLAVRVNDGSGNWSRVSNCVESQNRWLNGWTYLNTSNSALQSDLVTVSYIDGKGALWAGTASGVEVVESGTVRSWTLSDAKLGLGPVTAITEDTQGRIWVGATDGLSSFDGYQWAPVDPQVFSSSTIEVRSLESTSDGSLWCGVGFSGAYRFKGDSWSQHNATNGHIDGLIVWDIAEADDGAIWFATSSGVSRVHQDSWTSFNRQRDGLSEATMYSIAEDSEGRIWCGSSSGRINWFFNNRWTHDVLSPPWNNHPVKIVRIAKSHSGDMWLVGYGALWRWDFSKATYQYFIPDISGIPSRKLTDLKFGQDGTLVLATADKGLCRWDLRAAKLD